MAGRYPESVVAKHPAFDQGKAAAEGNEEQHIERAKSLMPKWLNRDEKKKWLQMAPEWSKESRLKKIYVDFLAEYCVLWVRIFNARKELDDEGWEYVTTGRHGTQRKSDPRVAQYNDDWRKLNSVVAQIGMSPATALRFNDKQGSLFSDDEFGNI